MPTWNLKLPVRRPWARFGAWPSGLRLPLDDPPPVVASPPVPPASGTAPPPLPKEASRLTGCSLLAFPLPPRCAAGCWCCRCAPRMGPSRASRFPDSCRTHTPLSAVSSLLQLCVLMVVNTASAQLEHNEPWLQGGLQVSHTGRSISDAIRLQERLIAQFYTRRQPRADCASMLLGGSWRCCCCASSPCKGLAGSWNLSTVTHAAETAETLCEDGRFYKGTWRWWLSQADWLMSSGGSWCSCCCALGVCPECPELAGSASLISRFCASPTSGPRPGLEGVTCASQKHLLPFCHLP